MHRFFFSLHDDVEIGDDEGVELPDLATARKESLKGIAGIVAEKIAEGDRTTLSHSLEVLDEERRPVLLLPFRELVED